MAYDLKVVERSHSYWIDVSDPFIKRMVWAYLKTITSTKTVTENRVKRTVYDATFATKTPCGTKVGILKPCLQDLVDYVGTWVGYQLKPVIVKEDIHEPLAVEVKFKNPEISFKTNEQEVAYNFCMRENPWYTTLECATGFGKTFLGLVTSSIMQVRTAFIMQAKHIKTWLKDTEGFFDMDKKKDVAIIRGRDSLINLIRLQKAGGLKAKHIYISSETFREYIKAYESGQDYCDVNPLDFWSFFQIGRVVRDEAHEALHTLVRQTLYMNVQSLLCLSATIVDESKFIMKMYKFTFPPEVRWKSSNNKHIEAYSVRYLSEHGLELRSSYGFGYSHARYEKNFLKKPYLRNQYFKMITDQMYEFDRDYKPGMKMIVFMALKEMCHLYADYLANIYPNRTVSAYLQETSEDVLKKAEILVTTIGSAGTGVDIPDLARSYNTVAIGSKKQAFQTMGRLRELKNYPGEYPKYYFFTNMMVPAHRKFERMRRVDLVDKTKKLGIIDIGLQIRKYRR